MPHARTTDPITSHIAEDDNAPRRPRQAFEVALLVRKFPNCTSHELSERSGMDRHLIARRLPDCEEHGWVTRGPHRPCTVNGKAAITWHPAGKLDAQYRLECEARYWLEHCQHDPAKIRILIAGLTSSRSPASIQALRAEMLRQFEERQHGQQA